MSCQHSSSGVVAQSPSSNFLCHCVYDIGISHRVPLLWSFPSFHVQPFPLTQVPVVHCFNVHPLFVHVRAQREVSGQQVISPLTNPFDPMHACPARATQSALTD